MDGGIKRINAIRTVTKPSRKNSTRVTLPRRSRIYGCPFQIFVFFLRAFINEVLISGVEGTSGSFRSLSYFREFICSLCESFGRRSTFICLNLFTPTVTTDVFIDGTASALPASLSQGCPYLESTHNHLLRRTGETAPQFLVILLRRWL